MENIDSSEDSSESERCYKEEEWREEVEDGGVAEEKGVEGGDDGGGQEDDDGVKESLNAINSRHDLRNENLNIIDKGVKAIDDFKSHSSSGGVFRSKGCGWTPNSNSGSSSSWVQDTFSSNVGHAHQPLMGPEGMVVGEKEVLIESPIRVPLSQPFGANPSER